MTSDKTPVLDAIDAWRGLAPCILLESFANCCLNIIRASHTVYLLELYTQLPKAGANKEKALVVGAFSRPGHREILQSPVVSSSLSYLHCSYLESLYLSSWI